MISIHLALEDKEYQKRLAERLAWQNSAKEIHSHLENDLQRKEVENNANSLSKEKVAEKKEEIEKKELWLISPGTKIDRSQKCCITFQTEPTEEEGECFCYQPFSRIQKTIIEYLYRFDRVEKTPGEEEMQIIYLYSPFGGIGVSGLAYQLAKYFAPSEKVALLSFDAYHQFSEEFIPFRLSDLLFYWETLSKVNLADFCVHQEGVDILHGPNHPTDLEVLRAKKKEDFNSLLRESGYTKIIVDLSSSGMENWCQPLQKGERFVVIKKMEEKWKAFVTNNSFSYLAVDRENALKEMVDSLKGGE